MLKTIAFLLTALSFSAARADVPSLKPVRMAHVTGFIEKSTFGKTISDERVCAVDAQIPVYDERSGDGSSSLPNYVTCETTLNGVKAKIVINGSVTINGENAYGPASKMVGGMLFVIVAGNANAGTQVSGGAGSEDLTVNSIKLSLITNNLKSPKVGGQEAFAAYLTIHDDQQ